MSVAAVQLRSDNGRIQANLERAEPFLEKAADQGAELILLPEFLPTGYIFTKEIWDAGEPRDGPTVRWLRAQSRRLGIHLGSSFLEAEGEDFYNTFVLTTPEGEEAGRVRKQTPAAFEAFFTKGGEGPHVIDTALGKIGVGICYENQLAYTPRLMCSHSVDLMLMPHSAPIPSTGFFFPRTLKRIFEENLKHLAFAYAAQLGIPVVFCNKSGPWKTPLPGLPHFTQDSSFPGFSSVVDSDGTVKSRLGGEEGIAMDTVVLDPARKTGVWNTARGFWALDVPRVLNLSRLAEFAGKISYQRDAERKQRAREIASGQG